MDITHLAGDRVPSFHFRSIADVDEAQDYAKSEGWNLRYLQLSPGRYDGTFYGLRFGGLYFSLKKHRCPSLHALGARPAQFVPIVLPLMVGGSLRFQGQALSEADAVAFHGRMEQDVLIEQEAQLAAIYLPEADYLRIWRSAYGPDAEMPGAGRQDALIGGPAIAGLKERVQSLFPNDPDSLETWFAGLEVHSIHGEITNLLVTAFADQKNSDAQKPNENGQHVSIHARRARDVMEARRYEPLALAEVCAEVGVSVRTLQYAFRSYFGISPARYHTVRRLAGARDDLRQADPAEASVTDIAFRWGFFHLGRFSLAYGKHFGEPPSRTLGQRQTWVFRGQRAPVTRNPGPSLTRQARSRPAQISSMRSVALDLLP